jgi:hypothetical protein
MTDLALGTRNWSLFDDTTTGFYGETARTVASLVATANRYTRQNASDWRTLAATRVRRLREECRQAGWDGYGAAPISAATERHAVRFVSKLPVDLPAPDVTPDNDGEVSFDWWFSPNAQFGVSVGPEGKLTYAGVIGKGVKRHGVEPFAEAIPWYVLSTIEDLVERFGRQRLRRPA